MAADSSKSCTDYTPEICAITMRNRTPVLAAIRMGSSINNLLTGNSTLKKGMYFL